MIINLLAIFSRPYLNKNAVGYQLSIGVNNKLSNKSFVGLSIGHSYNDRSTLPSDIKAAKIILKEESNRLPLSAGFPDWLDDEAWPGILLEEQPDRYFRFDLAFNYFQKYAFSKQNFQFGFGLLLSYREESELVKLVETSKLQGLWFKTTYDHSIPLFSYNNYLDLGSKVEVEYQLLSIRALKVGIKSAFIYYPFSKDVVFNNGLCVNLN